MKTRSNSRVILKQRTSIRKYLIAGAALSVLVVFVAGLFFYLNSNDQAKAANHQSALARKKGTTRMRSGKPQTVFGMMRYRFFSQKNNTLNCKPKTAYKKEKLSKFNRSFQDKQKGTPYKYVYSGASAAPPKYEAKVLLASADKNDALNAILDEENESKENNFSPLMSGPVYTWSKNLSPDERKVMVLSLPPAKELPPIRFITDQDEFSVVNMDSFMEALEMVNQGKMVLIEGHTDDVGTDAYNLKLSIKRVEKIRQLMLEAGANEDLITVKGYGETKPLVPNTNADNRQINRRIEFKIFDL